MQGLQHKKVIVLVSTSMMWDRTRNPVHFTDVVYSDQSLQVPNETTTAHTECDNEVNAVDACTCFHQYICGIG